MKNFMANVTFTFAGNVHVRAEDAEQARKILKEQLGLVMGGYVHCQDQEAIPNIAFDAHPTKMISELRLVEEPNPDLQ